MRKALATTEAICQTHRADWVKHGQPHTVVDNTLEEEKEILIESNTRRSQFRWHGRDLPLSISLPQQANLRHAWQLLEELCLTTIKEAELQRDADVAEFAQAALHVSADPSLNMVDAFLYMPPVVDEPCEPYEIPCSAHVDPGFITAIMESTPGLEVFHDHKWRLLKMGPNQVAVVVGSAWPFLQGGAGVKGCCHRVRWLDTETSTCASPPFRSSFTFEVRASTSGLAVMAVALQQQRQSEQRARQVDFFAKNGLSHLQGTDLVKRGDSGARFPSRVNYVGVGLVVAALGLVVALAGGFFADLPIPKLFFAQNW